jgi:hypothetical protein
MTKDEYPFEIDTPDEARKARQNMMMVREKVAVLTVDLAVFICESGELGEKLYPFSFAPDDCPLKESAQYIVYSGNMVNGNPVLMRHFTNGSYGDYTTPQGGDYEVNALMNHQRLFEFLAHVGQGLPQLLEMALGYMCQARIDIIADEWKRTIPVLRRWEADHPKPKAGQGGQ